MSSASRERKSSSPPPEGPSPAKRTHCEPQLGKCAFCFIPFTAMSEVIFAGRPSIVANAATHISVNGLIRLFAREMRFPGPKFRWSWRKCRTASSGWIFQVYSLWKGVEERPRDEGMSMSRIALRKANRY